MSDRWLRRSGLFALAVALLALPWQQWLLAQAADLAPRAVTARGELAGDGRKIQAPVPLQPGS